MQSMQYVRRGISFIGIAVLLDSVHNRFIAAIEKEHLQFSVCSILSLENNLIYRGLFLGTKSIVANILDKTLCVVCTCNLLLYYTIIMITLNMKRKITCTRRHIQMVKAQISLLIKVLIFMSNLKKFIFRRQGSGHPCREVDIHVRTVAIQAQWATSRSRICCIHLFTYGILLMRIIIIVNTYQCLNRYWDMV